MFVARSSFEKPRPLLRCVRTTSPSSTSTLRLIARSSRSTISDTVDFPAPERPVNQIVKPVVVMNYTLESIVSGPWFVANYNRRRATDNKQLCFAQRVNQHLGNFGAS